MRKKTYETPYMDRVQVVMENGIMKGSLGDDPTDTQNGLSIQDQVGSVAIGEDPNMSIKDEWKDGDGKYTWDN